MTVRQKKVNGYLINDYSHADKSKIDRDMENLFISYSQEQAGFETDIHETVLEVPMKQITRHLIHTLRTNLVTEIEETLFWATLRQNYSPNCINYHPAP